MIYHSESHIWRMEYRLSILRSETPQSVLQHRQLTEWIHLTVQTPLESPLSIPTRTAISELLPTTSILTKRANTPYKKISVKMAKETVEMMSASELRKCRKMGGFFGADRMSPIEYFMVSQWMVKMMAQVWKFRRVR